MTDPDTPDRRRLLLADGALATLATGAAAAPKMPVKIAPLPIAPQPLPFDPATLGWLSDRLITSHHANNDTGAVTRLGAIKTQAESSC